MLEPTFDEQNSSYPQFYTWQNYRCAYEVHQPKNTSSTGTPLLLIHPIGVGLSRLFWQRFCREWYQTNHQNLIFNPDLLGCGDSDTPCKAYKPIDWAEQLQYFLQTVVKQPVILIVQGALLPVAIELVKLAPSFIAGVVMSGPPPWKLITKKPVKWRQNLLWSIFNSPIGNAFFRYARTRNFLRSFSEERLFASLENVDEDWLTTLLKDAQNMGGRYAVFAFLARFWQRDYTDDIAKIEQPTLVVVGDTASSINKDTNQETPDERISAYMAGLPNGRGIKIIGRNVLPYESTTEFVAAISPFIEAIN
ncbi:hypothetical protein B6N60_01105 [Richelia sinica FACHB-800]|uniref:AB hydrolase-1 domain-containing protein n=1 Tax=Richelia sinica FACHB-800 TaxID=1357546 RepID=A0A975Y3T2_9NOST|nr:alpha/beta hydrolase [Richelia sinica]MBD2664342.1 alpha/beta hydrolase [Richelia sinica FACHB-800]QXE22422.1 hypothetical protein B6N60_01105 [Richelia sinica FACHB-800]